MDTRLIKIWLHPGFLGCVATYLVVFIWRKSHLTIPDFINGYLTDLVCMPFVLLICLGCVHIIKRNTNLTIPWWVILLVFAEYALLFEWILPARNSIYTADIWDVGMYAIGSLIFFLYQPILIKQINSVGEKVCNKKINN
ncbi:MAG: hypothetical protein IPH66_08435 [Crocinitomicaceae bacterium]|nr:hypothetical protein [Crocinitomicaceae bacterium]